MNQKQPENFEDTFLTDVEKDLLGTVADNALLMNALKKVVLADVYFKGVLRAGMSPEPTRNAAIAFAFAAEAKTNEQLGEDIRAFAEGVRLVEGGFSRLDKFKTGKPAAETPRNKAR